MRAIALHRCGDSASPVVSLVLHLNCCEVLSLAYVSAVYTANVGSFFEFLGESRMVLKYFTIVVL